jgi:hypothetical protein
MNKPEVCKIVVSRVEASRLLSISARSIGFLLESKRIPTVPVGRRTMIRVVDLLKFSESGTLERIRPVR